MNMIAKLRITALICYCKRKHVFGCLDLDAWAIWIMTHIGDTNEKLHFTWDNWAIDANGEKLFNTIGNNSCP